MPRASKPDRTQEAIDLLSAISLEFKVDVRTLRDKGKKANSRIYTKIRRIYCKRGRLLRLTTLELGIALNRDHTTVSYHANPAIRARKQLTRPPWIPRAQRYARKADLERNGGLNHGRRLGL